MTQKRCIWPLNQASTVEALRKLSYETKVRDRLGPEIVRRLWPDLLSVPINTPYGSYRCKEQVREAK